MQTIILTRGEGRTPMPEKEQLHKLAASQSTMCIFLSAGIAGQVQKELLEHYPPTTTGSRLLQVDLERRTHLPRRIERPGTDRKRKQSDTDDLVSRR